MSIAFASVSFPRNHQTPELQKWSFANPEETKAYSMFKALVMRSDQLPDTMRFLFFIQRHKPNGLTIKQEKSIQASKNDWKVVGKFFTEDWPKIEKAAKNNTAFYSSDEALASHKSLCFAIHQHTSVIMQAHQALERLLQAFQGFGVPLEPKSLAVNSLVTMLGNDTSVSPSLMRSLVARFVEPAEREAA